MVLFSLNLNKIALLRNSRGSDYPNLLSMAKRALAVGVRGITVHPRPDERHIKYRDVYQLAELLTDYPQVEFNIEGYPVASFLELVHQVAPTQCTLVPDDPGQLTSDHGWNVAANKKMLSEVVAALAGRNIRSALFMDPNPALMAQVAAVKADRIELYTEDYARAFGSARQQAVLDTYIQAARSAKDCNLAVNAGHDLNLDNLATLLNAVTEIEEVSIGHAVMVEVFDAGFEPTLKKYLEITQLN